MYRAKIEGARSDAHTFVRGRPTREAMIGWAREQDTRRLLNAQRAQILAKVFIANEQGYRFFVDSGGRISEEPLPRSRRME